MHVARGMQSARTLSTAFPINHCTQAMSELPACAPLAHGLNSPFPGAPCSGLTGAGGQLAFRAGHPVTLKNGMDVHKAPPALPSDADARHVYGATPDYRSPEQIRVAGCAGACPGRAACARCSCRVKSSKSCVFASSKLAPFMSASAVGYAQPAAH